MKEWKPKPRQGPEAKIQANIILMLRGRGWFVKETHGNKFQWGFPDLWASHKRYGHRWIEVKNGDGAYDFTPAQLESFPLFCNNGSGVWILKAATPEEYDKLFKPPNWLLYLMIKGG